MELVVDFREDPQSTSGQIIEQSLTAATARSLLSNPFILLSQHGFSSRPISFETIKTLPIRQESALVHFVAQARLVCVASHPINELATEQTFVCVRRKS